MKNAMCTSSSNRRLMLASQVALSVDVTRLAPDGVQVRGLDWQRVINECQVRAISRRDRDS